MLHPIRDKAEDEAIAKDNSDDLTDAIIHINNLSMKILIINLC